MARMANYKARNPRQPGEKRGTSAEWHRSPQGRTVPRLVDPPSRINPPREEVLTRLGQSTPPVWKPTPPAGHT